MTRGPSDITSGATALPSDEIVAERRAAIGLTSADRILLSVAADSARPAWPGLVERLYDRFRAQDEIAHLLSDADRVERLRAQQTAYLGSLFSADLNRDHAAQMHRIGSVHFRIRLTPDWYVATYAHLFCDNLDALVAADDPTSEELDTVLALLRSIFYDITLVLDAYGEVEARERLERRAHEIVADAPPGGLASRPSVGAGPDTRSPALSYARVDSSRVADRVRFLGIGETERAALRRLAPRLGAALPEVLERFYGYVSDQPRLAASFSPASILRLKSQVASFWQEACESDLGRPYAASRVRIGLIHERIGLSLQWYLGGLARQLSDILTLARPSREEIKALVRLAVFDASFIIDGYMDARRESLLRGGDFAQVVLAGLASAVAIVNGDGRIVSANPAMVSLAPGPSALLYQSPVEMVLPMPALATLMAQARKNENGRATANDRLGSRRFRITALRLDTAGSSDDVRTALILDDITELLQTQAVADEVETGLARLSSHVGAVLFQADHDGRLIEAVSPQVAGLTGYRDIYFLGRSDAWFGLVVDEDLPAVRAAVRDAHGGVSVEYRIATALGETRWIRSHVTAPDDAVDRTYWVNLDITIERREAEARLERDKARRDAEAAAAANKAKTQFLATMSHELRTPMNGVIGMAHVLRTTALDDAQSRHVDMMIQSADNMVAILNDILDLSKVEAGRLELELAPVNLREVCETVAGMWAHSASAKGVALRTLIDAATPQWVRSDALRVRQILLNLVSNAVKFTAAGAVTLSVGPAATGDALLIEVADTGPGMTESVRASLFSEYSQAGADIARRFGGTGLGLAISRRLAELMGGDISVASEPGIGSTFSVRLPMQPCEPAAPARRLAPEALNLHGLNLLVVDDNEANRVIAATLLGAVGARVDVAASGTEALRMLKACAYDAVIMDVHMPEMDGIEATRRIRQGEAGPADVPIIALTADVVVGQASELVALGFDDVQAKPIAPPALISAIASRRAATA